MPQKGLVNALYFVVFGGKRVPKNPRVVIGRYIVERWWCKTSRRSRSISFLGEALFGIEVIEHTFPYIFDLFFQETSFVIGEFKEKSERA